MDIKNLQDAMKLQKELNVKLNQRLEALRKGKAPSLDALIKEKEKSLTRLRSDVKNAAKERELAVKRWDQRIEQRQASVTSLENELVELKKQVTGGDIKPNTGNRKKSPRKKK